MEMSDRKRLAHLVRSTRQHDVLIRLARQHGWRIGAEIGVLKGKTLFALLDAVPELVMYGVDQWQRLPLRAAENAETYADFDMGKLRHAVIMRARGYPGRCHLLAHDSAEAARGLANGSLDFAFIDGDHTEPGVERDIRAWTPKVRPGGMLLGHDHHWSTVRRVIDLLCPGWIDHGEAVWGLPIEGVQL
jgi:hypothetical protein